MSKIRFYSLASGTLIATHSRGTHRQGEVELGPLAGVSFVGIFILAVTFFNFIEEQARKKQTSKDNIAREYCQHLFLSKFCQQEGVEKILFKGGTALRILNNRDDQTLYLRPALFSLQRLNLLLQLQNPILPVHHELVHFFEFFHLLSQRHLQSFSLDGKMEGLAELLSRRDNLPLNELAKTCLYPSRAFPGSVK